MPPPDPDSRPQNTSKEAWGAKKATIAALMQMLGLVLFAAGLMVASHYFPIGDYITNAHRKITELEIWGALLHPILFGLCNVCLLPGGVLAVAAGLFFGLWNGWILNVLGSVLGAAISFFIARKFGRSWIIQRFRQSGRFSNLEQSVQTDGWKIVFLSQLHPLFPTSLLNYLYGLTSIRPATCLLWVGLGQAPGLFLYAYLGTLAQHGLRIWRRDQPVSAMEWTLGIGGLVLAVAICIVLARISFRMLGDPETGPLRGINKTEPVAVNPGLEKNV